MDNTKYSIKASILRMIFWFSTLLGFQWACYEYIAHSDYITFSFILFVIVWFFCFLLEIFSIYFLFKSGRPQIIFSSTELNVSYFNIHLNLPYSVISSLTLRKVENEYRGFTTGYDYELSLNFHNNIKVQNGLRKVDFETNSYLLPSKFFYSKKQIFKATIILMTLRRRSPNKRNEILEKLNQKSFNYEKLISTHELKNFKNNQYISKTFKSGQ